MPYVTMPSSGGPTDYATPFASAPCRHDGPRIASLRGLLDVVKRSSLLRKRLLPEWFAEGAALSADKEKFGDFLIAQTAHELADRYIHVYNSKVFVDARFDDVFRPLEKGMLDDPLWIDIAVPILFVHFPFDEVRLSENASIRRMNDPFQRARAFIKTYGPGAHEDVIAAATHALVLEGWTIPNEGRWPFAGTANVVAAYPSEEIDLFFASLRIETGIYTGYAQLLAVPRDWMLHWRADLPPLEGASTRAYPLLFENFYWLADQLPKVDRDTVQRVAQLWRSLTAATENRLKIAVRRLNLCFLRDLPEDVAIDATIGLEAALSDTEPQEMTHKLALRVGGLSRFFASCRKSARQVFREIKQIYSYRSAIVHGSSSAEKKREVRISETESTQASTLAVEYLRAVIRVLALRPEFRDPAYIDEHLLLDKAGTNIEEGAASGASENACQ